MLVALIFNFILFFERAIWNHLVFKTAKVAVGKTNLKTVASICICMCMKSTVFRVMILEIFLIFF